jgi:hypothetical protein
MILFLQVASFGRYFFCLRFFSFFWTLTVLGHVGRWGSKKILGVALTADAEEFFLGKKSRERKKIPHFF